MLVSNNKVLKINNKWLNGRDTPVPPPPVYIPRNVNIITTEGGTISAVPTSGYDGNTVSLSNIPVTGYTFTNYSVTGATLYDSNKFNFNGSDVDVKGNFNLITPITVVLTDRGSEDLPSNSPNPSSLQYADLNIPDSSELNYITISYKFHASQGLTQSSPGFGDTYNLTDSNFNRIWESYCYYANNTVEWGHSYNRFHSIVETNNYVSSWVVEPDQASYMTYESNRNWYANIWYAAAFNTDQTHLPGLNIKYVFDRSNRIGYFLLGGTLIGHAVLNIDPINIKYLFTEHIPYTKGFTCNYIKSAMFNNLSSAMSWGS